jgi:serine/threonine-protein kinase
MATVHIARGVGARGFERLFAVKCCHPHLRKEGDFATMFLDEARLAASIHHPNVVPVVDMGEEDDVVFLVMEYVDGERLSRLMKAARAHGRALPIPVIVRLFRDVLAGLHAAHEATSLDGTPLRIVHRDVTPENILVGSDGAARLIDFGIAKAAVRETATTQGVVKGKLAYLAPEQLGSSAIDRRVDLWAAGVSLWEALANQRLFGGVESHAQIVAGVLNGTIAPPSSRNPDVPRALDAIAMRALRRNPDARFATALEMSAALEDPSIPVATPREVAAVVAALLGDVLEDRRSSLSRALDDAKVVTARPAEPTEATAPFSLPKRRRPLWAALTFGVAALALVTSRFAPAPASPSGSSDPVSNVRGSPESVSPTPRAGTPPSATAPIPPSAAPADTARPTSASSSPSAASPSSASPSGSISESAARVDVHTDALVVDRSGAATTDDDSAVTPPPSASDVVGESPRPRRRARSTTRGPRERRDSRGPSEVAFDEL